MLASGIFVSFSKRSNSDENILIITNCHLMTHFVHKTLSFQLTNHRLPGFIDQPDNARVWRNRFLGGEPRLWLGDWKPLLGGHFLQLDYGWGPHHALLQTPLQKRILLCALSCCPFHSEVKVLRYAWNRRQKSEIKWDLSWCVVNWMKYTHAHSLKGSAAMSSFSVCDAVLKK